MKKLYILMRNDLDSLNPGKAMAQAAHAANCFWQNAKNDNEAFEWANETSQGFGTTLVLQADIQTIREVISHANCCGFEAAIITDPTYPIKDGQITHLVRLETCGYVFCEGDSLERFKLYP